MKAGVTLPRRIYVDTGTLQTTYDYGKTLWENELFEPLPRDVKVPDWLTRSPHCATSSLSTNVRTSSSP